MYVPKNTAIKHLSEIVKLNSRYCKVVIAYQIVKMVLKIHTLKNSQPRPQGSESAQHWGSFVLLSLVHHFTTVNPLLRLLFQISTPHPKIKSLEES